MLFIILTPPRSCNIAINIIDRIETKQFVLNSSLYEHPMGDHNMVSNWTATIFSCRWCTCGAEAGVASTDGAGHTAPQHLVCRAVQSLHINRMQTGIIEVFKCRRLHTNTSTILICIWLVCRLCTTLRTKCCGAVTEMLCRGGRGRLLDGIQDGPNVA